MGQARRMRIGSDDVGCLEVLGFAWRDEAQLVPVPVAEVPVAAQGAVAAACGRGSYGLAGAWARAGVVERPERSAGRASIL